MKLDVLRQVIDIWYAEFADKDLPQRKAHYATLGKREQLVYDMVNLGPMDGDLAALLQEFESLGKKQD